MNPLPWMRQRWTEMLELHAALLCSLTARRAGTFRKWLQWQGGVSRHHTNSFCFLKVLGKQQQQQNTSIWGDGLAANTEFPIFSICSTMRKSLIKKIFLHGQKMSELSQASCFIKINMKNTEQNLRMIKEKWLDVFYLKIYIFWLDCEVFKRHLEKFIIYEKNLLL